MSNEPQNKKENISNQPNPIKSKTHVPPPKKIVKEVKIENVQNQNEEDIFDMGGNKETNEVEEKIFDIPKKQVKPPALTSINKNSNKKTTQTKIKKKTEKDLFNFEEDAEEDIFSKKDGVASIFDTDDNDKENKDNAGTSIFD